MCCNGYEHKHCAFDLLKNCRSQFCLLIVSFHTLACACVSALPYPVTDASKCKSVLLQSSQEGQGYDREPTETDYLSLWEHVNSRLTENLLGTYLGPLHVYCSCVACSACKAPISENKIVSSTELAFGNLLPMLDYFMQGEVLYLSST